MRKRILYVFAAVLIIIGCISFFYPRILQWQYDREIRKEEEDFVDKRDEPDDSKNPMDTQNPDSRLEELYQKLQAENERLYAQGQETLQDPFNYLQPSIDLSAYGLSDNRIGYLKVPAMDIVLPIYLGANEENMATGAVHLTGTSYPIGGDNTNVVIAAHRGYATKAMFRNIETLKPGDTIEIENFRETLVYRVVETRIVSPNALEDIKIQPGRDLITFSTCHPYTQNYQRYLVYSERVK